MAIHYLQSNMDAEDIALGEIRDDRTYDDDSDLQTAETGFGPGIQDGERAPAETPLTLSQKGQLKQTAIDTLYNVWASGDKGISPEGGKFPDNFVYSEENGIRLKNFPDVRLTSTFKDVPLSLSTIAGKSSAKLVRDELGFSNYGLKPSAKAEAAKQSALQEGNANLGDLNKEAENVEMQDLSTIIVKATGAVKNMETAFNNAEIDERNEGDTTGIQFPTREIRGLDKALQTIRGELVNNLAKLTELDNHITREQNKLDEPDIGDFERRRIAERIRDLKDERVSRLEAASASREALRSQISRIRETINHLINEDTTLAERIRTLFREQGITIVSILTALGMVISTLVLAISGGSAVVVPTPPSKGGLREWVKKYLHALGRVLAKLAAKAGAALPGIIGSVVGWLLNLLSKTAGWLASNLWALMLAVGGILLIAAREWLAIR